MNVNRREFLKLASALGIAIPAAGTSGHTARAEPALPPPIDLRSGPPLKNRTISRGKNKTEAFILSGDLLSTPLDKIISFGQWRERLTLEGAIRGSPQADRFSEGLTVNAWMMNDLDMSRLSAHSEGAWRFQYGHDVLNFRACISKVEIISAFDSISEIELGLYLS